METPGDPTPLRWRRCKRAAFRFRVPRSWATYSANGVEGRASVADISTTGVCFHAPSEPLAPGTLARVALSLVEGTEPVDVAIEVARETRSGFAGRFIDVGPLLAGRLADELNHALQRCSQRGA